MVFEAQENDFALKSGHFPDLEDDHLILIFFVYLFWILILGFVCCFLVGLLWVFSYSLNLSANLDEVVGRKRGKMSSCQRGSRRIWEKRNCTHLLLSQGRKYFSLL